MKRNLFRFSSAFVAVLAVAACTDDPTEAFRQGATQVATSLSYVEITIGDSVVVTAQTKDAQGNALSALPEVATANPAIASVNIDTVITGKPSPETQFSILANGFGTTTVTASSGSLTGDVTVQTWPASVGITGAASGAALGSGTTVALTPTALSSGNAAFGAGNADLYFIWGTTDATIVSVDTAGNITAAAPGLATIDVEAFRLADSLSTGAEGSVSLSVVPGTLTGTPSTTTGIAGSAATITAAAGDPPFDDNTIGTLDLLDLVGIAPGGFPHSATQFSFMMPPSVSVGAHSLVFSGIGPAEIAQEMTFTVTAGAFADLWEATDVFGAGANPMVHSGRYFVQIDPVDIDDFFLIDNSAGTTGLKVDLTVDWVTGADDVDVVVYTTAGGFVTCASACTGAKPEHGSWTVPAGAMHVLNIDLYAGGANVVTIDATLTQLP
jgi:hypothetical protein